MFQKLSKLTFVNFDALPKLDDSTHRVYLKYIDKYSTLSMVNNCTQFEY